jgi:hypothetical protein
MSRLMAALRRPVPAFNNLAGIKRAGKNRPFKL